MTSTSGFRESSISYSWYSSRDHACHVVDTVVLALVIALNINDD